MNEKNKVLRDLIAKVIVNKQEKDKEKAKKVKKEKTVVKKKAVKPAKDENKKDIKLPPHPLLGNNDKKSPKDKKPNFEKILPDLQKKSVNSGNVISNIQNKLIQRKTAKTGK